MQYTSSIFLLLEQEWDVGLPKKKKKGKNKMPSENIPQH